MAYGQYTHERLGNHHKIEEIASDVGEDNLTISIGERVMENGQRMSKKRVGEIENLLIYSYKPPYNMSKHRTYRGRPLIVNNSGPGNPFNDIISTSSVDHDDWWD